MREAKQQVQRALLLDDFLSLHQSREMRLGMASAFENTPTHVRYWHFTSACIICAHTRVQCVILGHAPSTESKDTNAFEAAAESSHLATVVAVVLVCWQLLVVRGVAFVVAALKKNGGLQRVAHAAWEGWCFRHVR